MTDRDTPTTSAVSLLTGEQAPLLLQSALSGSPDAAVPGFTATVDGVHDRIGAETSVTYHVTYEHDGTTVADYLVATTADLPEEAAATVEADGHIIRIWRHPSDPRLPGLLGACTPSVLGSWLPGAESRGAQADATDVLVYRPMRRAVLRTRRGDDVYFTKVVRASRGELLDRRHTLLEGLGPDVVARPEPGVLVTAQVPGLSLATSLSMWQLDTSGEQPRPQPADAVSLLDRLPAEVLDLPVRRSWTDRIDFHGAMAAAALPEHADEIETLVNQIETLVEAFPVGPVVPTHGDFHDGNIFCVDGRPVRMIDVDTVGPGRREDDLACLLAHLAVLPDLSPGHYPRGHEVTDAWAREIEALDLVHPGALRIRVAAVILSLVSGTPRSTALARLDLARAWAWRADTLHR